MIFNIINNYYNNKFYLNYKKYKNIFKNNNININNLENFNIKNNLNININNINSIENNIYLTKDFKKQLIKNIKYLSKNKQFFISYKK